MHHARRAVALILAGFALVSLAGACAPSAGYPSVSPSDQAVFDHIADLKSKTVALVEPMREDTADLFGVVTPGPVVNRLYCSGVWIDQNTIVTANHCVEDLNAGDNVFYSTEADVSPSDGDAIATAHMSELIALDAAHDLAFLRVGLPPAHGVAELAQNVVVGQRDASMGHPLGLLWSYSEGLVSAVRRTGDLDLNLVWVQSTAPISPGNSGGGLFNDRGELLGICSRGYFTHAENLNFYVHVDYVRNLYSLMH